MGDSSNNNENMGQQSPYSETVTDDQYDSMVPSHMLGLYNETIQRMKSDSDKATIAALLSKYSDVIRTGD